VAEVREPPRVVHLHVDAPRQEIAVHGGDFGQWNEWNYETDLQWDLLQWPTHSGVQKLIADLNALYRREPALYEQDFNGNGFEWIDCHSADNSVLVYLRKARIRGLPGGLLQLHAGRPVSIPRRAAATGLVPGDLQQRLAVLRRQQRGQLSGCERRELQAPRAALLDARATAAAGVAVFKPHR